MQRALLEPIFGNDGSRHTQPSDGASPTQQPLTDPHPLRSVMSLKRRQALNRLALPGHHPRRGPRTGTLNAASHVAADPLSYTALNI